MRFLLWVLNLLIRFLRKKQYFIQGGELMITVPGTHADVTYIVKNFTIVDSEGTAVTDQAAAIAALGLHAVPRTSDSDALTAESTGPFVGLIKFGTGTKEATFFVDLVGTDGHVFKTYSEEFMITTGDPFDIIGGELVFEGL
jgi:hypothetical protein